MKKELSKREKEVLKLIIKGDMAKEIGKELLISTRTVQAHTANMLKKTGAKNSSHLVAMHFENKESANKANNTLKIESLERVNMMCTESLPPELFEQWEFLKENLIVTRKDLIVS